MRRLHPPVLALALAITLPPSAGCKGGASDDSATESETGDPLPPELDPVTTVAETLVPFDVNREDLVGPGVHATNYGKTPEIIVAPDGEGGLAVYAHDYTDPEARRGWLLRVQPSLEDYVITAAVEPPMLGRIMGVAVDEAGEPFVASGVIEGEQLTTEYPAPGEYRSGIVRVLGLDWSGGVKFDVDLDLAREAFDEPELLINPMTAGSSRMAYGAGTLALLHSINTNPDDNDVRHQKAITTHLYASNGGIVRTSSIWVSHSFDQRVFHDGQGFIEAHLGDAYPRHIAFARVSPDSGEYPLFHIKGPIGDNVTRTLLGDVAMIEDDPDYGYIALFVTERSPGLDPISEVEMHARIAGTRELAMVRIQRDFETHEQDTKNALPHLDPALPDSLDVTVGEDARSNKLRWLSDYDAEGSGTIHAERPKLVAIGDDRYIALWERWQLGGEVYAFTGTYAMLIDAMGETLAGPEQVSSAHLPRGDDAFPLERGAAWMTGDSEARELHLHIVKPDLDKRVIIIE